MAGASGPNWAAASGCTKLISLYSSTQHTRTYLKRGGKRAGGRAAKATRNLDCDAPLCGRKRRRNSAVHARNGRASHTDGEKRARYATTECHVGYDPRPLGCPNSVLLVTGRPRTPWRHCTVDWTHRCYRAGAIFSCARACDAPSRGGSVDCPDPLARSSVACERARAPRLPCSVGAVDWACKRGAAERLREDWTQKPATVSCCLH